MSLMCLITNMSASSSIIELLLADHMQKTCSWDASDHMLLRVGTITAFVFLSLARIKQQAVLRMQGDESS